MQMQKPLAGIKVLSFEIQVAGPYCSMMLADQGAAVIKVEQPGSGDTARGGAPRITNERGEQQSGYFLRFNRNKRSLTLNLKSEAGRQIFRDLARGSDVLIENFRPGLLDEMGLGYDALSKDNPGLVYASITGFGSLEGYPGPHNKRPAAQPSGRPALGGHEGATSGPERAGNMAGWLGQTIAGWFRGQTTAEAAERLLAAGLPAGPVQNAQEIHECPHVKARGTLIDVPDPILGTVRLGWGPP